MARILWAALCVALFACVYSFPVRANEVHTGTGLVCDTREQVALFASLVEGRGPQAAMAAVNEDAKTANACVIAGVALVVVEKLDKLTIGGRPYVIVKILIGGVVTPNGMQPVPPKEFYTLFHDADGRPA